MKPTVFLTGATGFLGMEVLARLLERGDEDVVALVRGRQPSSRLRAAMDVAGIPDDGRRARVAHSSRRAPRPSPGAVTSPRTAVTRARYGDGSSHSFSRTS